MGPQSAVDREFIYIRSGGGSSLFFSLFSLLSSFFSRFSLLSSLFSLFSSLFSLLFSKKKPQNQINGLSSTRDAIFVKKARLVYTRRPKTPQKDYRIFIFHL